MGAKNKKNSKKVDLLEMPKNERLQLIREVKEKLQQKVTEEKLWQSLLETENVTVNGKVLFRDQEQLTGVSSEANYTIIRT
ncbi:hypothetical protein HXY33_05045 [Candidatus Bathyarchaeota archaeon]|nr:hypothetical protein [Candidatus Bathyarchaeota archaeon]